MYYVDKNDIYIYIVKKWNDIYFVDENCSF